MVSCYRVGGTECSSACIGPFEGDHHYSYFQSLNYGEKLLKLINELSKAIVISLLGVFPNKAFMAIVYKFFAF